MPYRTPVGRTLNSLPYLGYVAVGVVAAASPSQAVEDRIRAGAYAWAALFLLGGSVGAFGALRRRWVTERWGCGLVIVANSVYAASLTATFALKGNLTALLLAVIFLILVAELVMRQYELTRLARESARIRREGT